MFEQDDEGFYMASDSTEKDKQRVTIIHQDFFLKDKTNKFSSKGIDWAEMEKAILSLIAGNTYNIVNAKLKGSDMLLKSHKILVIEGSHIFMPSSRV